MLYAKCGLILAALYPSLVCILFTVQSCVILGSSAEITLSRTFQQGLRFVQQAEAALNNQVQELYDNADACFTGVVSSPNELNYLHALAHLELVKIKYRKLQLFRKSQERSLFEDLGATLKQKIPQCPSDDIEKVVMLITRYGRKVVEELMEKVEWAATLFPDLEVSKLSQLITRFGLAPVEEDALKSVREMVEAIGFNKTRSLLDEFIAAKRTAQIREEQELKNAIARDIDIVRPVLKKMVDDINILKAFVQKWQQKSLVAIERIGSLLELSDALLDDPSKIETLYSNLGVIGFDLSVISEACKIIKAMGLVEAKRFVTDLLSGEKVIVDIDIEKALVCLTMDPKWYPTTSREWWNRAMGAVKDDCFELMKLLMLHDLVGGDDFFQDRISLLHIACGLGNKRMATFLLEHKNPLRQSANEILEGMSPVLLASVEGHVGVLEIIHQRAEWFHKEEELQNNKRIRKYPVHLASTANKSDAVAFLMRSGYPADELDGDNQTALSIALEKQNGAVINVLKDTSDKNLALSQWQRAHEKAVNGPGWNVFHMAALLNAVEVVRLALEIGLGGHDCGDFCNRTPAHIACKSGATEIAILLFEKTPDLLFKPDDEEKIPLYTAMDYGHQRLAVLLLEKFPKKLLSLGNRLTESAFPLHYAARMGCTEVIDACLKEHANLCAAKDAAQKAPIHYALQSKKEAIVLLLADKDPHWASHVDQDGNTAIHIAGRKKLKDLCLKLMKLAARDNLCQRSKDGKTPLHIVMENGWNEPLEAALSMHKDLIDLQDKVGQTFLYLAVLRKDEIMVTLLLGLNAKISVGISEGGENALHLAVRQGSLSILNLLINNSDKIDLIAGDSLGRAPIHLAVDAGREDIVGVLMNEVPDCTQLADKKGVTPMHMAARKGLISIFKAMLGAHATFFENLKNLVRDAAYKLSDSDMYKTALIYFVLNRQAADGKTAFHLAVQRCEEIVSLDKEVRKGDGSLQIIELLLGFGEFLDTNLKDDDGKRAIDYAKRADVISTIHRAESQIIKSAIGTALSIIRNKASVLGDKFLQKAGDNLGEATKLPH